MLGLARSGLILGHQFTEEAISFHNVRLVIEKKIKEGVEVSPGLFLAVPDPRLVTFAGGQSRKRVFPLWRIEQQAYKGVQNPPDVSGYRLTENKFGGPIRIFGLPISRTPGGWEYALYRRID